MGKPTNPKAAMAAYSLMLLAINVVLIWPLLRIEYSAYTGSIEGTFIGLARLMAKYPGERAWWPFWNGGMPFELSYLPLTHWLAAGLTAVTGLSAARGYHVFAAAAYALGPVTIFWMAVGLSGRVLNSFVAGFAVSCVSATTLLVPIMALDAGGALYLRRLRNLIAYGESPHIFALTMLPLAILAFERALRLRSGFWSVVAGCAAAIVVLSNAFGAAALVAALVCLLVVRASDPWWLDSLRVVLIGIVAFCGVLPWLSPALIRAIQANAPTSGGDFRYTPATWVTAGILVIGFLGVRILIRKLGVSKPTGLFLLLAYIPTTVVGCWHAWKIAVIPQPYRYELEMDIALLLAVVFTGGAMLARFGSRVRVCVTGVVLAALGMQTVHMCLYSRKDIRWTDPTGLSEYKIAKWLDANRPGERTFVPGSASFLLNAFSDVPQLHGGHDQHTRNTFVPVASYTIYSGMNAGPRDAEISVFWLKALGVRTVAVTGPRSTEVYKGFVKPHKFDGVLPLLWRDGDDAIYEVPGRSLAHVIPREAVVARRPIHGLDIAPAERYVDALDDPSYPLATMAWNNLHEAVIRAPLKAGQVISVQVTYDAGWVAFVNGREQPIRSDAIGQMVIEPDCVGSCEILLTFTGGWEKLLARTLSLLAVAIAGFVLYRGWRGP